MSLKYHISVLTRKTIVQIRGSQGKDTYTNSTVESVFRPDRRGLNSRGKLQGEGGATYTDELVTVRNLITLAFSNLKEFV